MISISRNPINVVVAQHAEEVAHLYHVRAILAAAPHVRLLHLGRFDERIAAHLDGLAVAGEYGSRICETALASPSPGVIFAATVRAIEAKDEQRLDKLFSLVAAVPEAQSGLIAAFGWVSATHLQGIGVKLLTSTDASRRLVGIGACAMHGVDPGAVLTQALTDPDASLRARALRAAGELGRRDLLGACHKGLKDHELAVRFWAARSLALLGEGEKAVEELERLVHSTNAFRARAMRVLQKLLAPSDAQSFLRGLAQDVANKRLLIEGAGIAGDAHYLSWLITQMGDDKFARLAGESFSMITGLDLAYLDLDRKPPQEITAGPNENPEDENVDMDADDSLPWPDVEKLRAWWQSNQSRFQPGTRYFMGAPPDEAHCREVLQQGFQRQRGAAAEYLCLRTPGSRLFNTEAPVWRQRRWLGTMTASH